MGTLLYRKSLVMAMGMVTAQTAIKAYLISEKQCKIRSVTYSITINGF